LIDSARYPHAFRGIGLMLLAVSTFACLDSTSKYLSQYYPAPSIVWLRCVLQTLVMTAIFALRMGLGLVRTSSPGLQAVRALFLTASSLIFVVALSYLQIAVVTSITFTSPILVALAAGPLLGERASRTTWFALAGSFAGVLLIIRPGSASFTWHLLLPLLCAFGVGGYQILTRKLAGRGDHPITTLFLPGVLGCLLIPPVFPGSFFVLPTEIPHVIGFIGVGIFGAVGHFLLIRAHEYAPATLLTPFNYVQILIVLVIGWIVFGQLPDGIALVGIALIASSGLGLILASRRG
jgi:drug/metabolite transporter (DMT)-like permease